jgi:signal transduction histidine kinase
MVIMPRQPSADGPRPAPFAKRPVTAVSPAERAPVTPRRRLAPRERRLAAARAVQLERERIARELHDLVMGRITRLGFTLASTKSTVSGATAHRLEEAIGEVDELLEELRRVVLDLPRRASAAADLEATLRDLVRYAEARLEGNVELQLDGDLDALPAPLIAQLKAVATEAVHNAVAHSGASLVQVRLTVDHRLVEIVVRDDGSGTAGSRPGLGMSNLAARARHFRGSFEIGSDADGTETRWRVPLHRP